MRRCSEIFCRLLEYCWISRNLDQVSECVRAGNVSDIIPHALFLSLFHPFPHTHTHKNIYIQHHFNPSLAECEPSRPALCDDVTFFSPQGGCWGLKSPAGHPWHPSFPLLFVPWWGNRHLGGWWMRPVAWNQALHPAPSSLFGLLWQIPPSYSYCLQTAWSHPLRSPRTTEHAHAHSHITNRLHNLYPDCMNQHHSETLKDQSQWASYFTYNWINHTNKSDRNTNIYSRWWSESHK